MTQSVSTTQSTASANISLPIHLSVPHMTGEELEWIKEAFDSNFIAPLGPHVDAFEKEFAQALGLDHTLAVVSGTAAMHLALRCWGVEKDDTVIASTLTFIGSVTPAVFQGADLVFIDSDHTTWNMDPNLLAEELAYLDQRGTRPAAVVVTDIFGQCADLDALGELCERYDTPLICDAAESVGATYKNRSAGYGAAAAIYSFNGNKIITTGGGGMLTSSNEELVEKARFLSYQAREPVLHYEHQVIGYNYRLSNILAAIGRAQLKVLPDRVAARRHVYEYYAASLGDMPGLSFMPEAPYGRCSRWLTVALIDPTEFGTDRNQLIQALAENHIESRPAWKPMHMQPVFKGSRYRGRGVSETIFDRGICLPSSSQLTEKELDRVVAVIRSTCTRV